MANTTTHGGDFSEIATNVNIAMITSNAHGNLGSVTGRP
jgi:hypothetical protein